MMMPCASFSAQLLQSSLECSSSKTMIDFDTVRLLGMSMRRPWEPFRWWVINPRANWRRLISIALRRINHVSSRETFSRLNEPMPIGVTICLSSDYGYREGRKTNIWPPSKCARDCVKFISDVFLRLFFRVSSCIRFEWAEANSVQVGSIHNEVQIDNRFTSKTLKPSAFVLDQTSSNNVTSNTDTRRCCTFFCVLQQKPLNRKAGQVQWRCLPGVFKANKFVLDESRASFVGWEGEERSTRAMPNTKSFSAFFRR